MHREQAAELEGLRHDTSHLLRARARPGSARASRHAVPGPIRQQHACLASMIAAHRPCETCRQVFGCSGCHEGGCWLSGMTACICSIERRESTARRVRFTPGGGRGGARRGQEGVKIFEISEPKMTKIGYASRTNRSAPTQPTQRNAAQEAQASPARRGACTRQRELRERDPELPGPAG